MVDQSARTDIEYIIIDGKSTDGTSELILKYADEIDIYICEKDTGIYNAMNKGLYHAHGEYVIFMNSGDCFSHTNVIASTISAIDNHSATPALVYGDYRELKEGVYTSQIPSRTPKWIWYGPIASHQSTFYNLAFLRQHGLSYDESYKIAADYKLTLEVITRAAGNALRISVCISDFDTSGSSNTNQDLGLREANRVRQELLGWGRFRSCILTVLLLSARYMKKNVSTIYKLIRY